MARSKKGSHKADMKEKRLRLRVLTDEGSQPVLQVPLNYIKEDGDGYYIFPLPASIYVQRLDGEPLDGKDYIRLTISEEGKVKREKS